MTHGRKVVDLDDLARTMSELRGQGATTGLAHGCFDVLHLGHVRYLARAKDHCDFLAVTVTPDAFVEKGVHRPVFCEEQRVEVLAALTMVDAVAVNRWRIADKTISMLRPSFYFKGQDRRSALDDPESDMHTEASACRTGGGEVLFIDEIVFSSTSLAMRYYSPMLK